MSFKLVLGTPEKEFRVDQLIGVLFKMLKDNETFKQTLPLFEDILNTLLVHGNLTMISKVLSLMNHLKIKRNSSIENIFFNAIRKERDIIKKKIKDDKTLEMPKMIKISDMMSYMESREGGAGNLYKVSKASLDSTDK